MATTGDKAAAGDVAPSSAGGIREEQVNNAVAFLTHPKVKESSESSKRSFLASKGLTKEEVAEAFKRVGPAAASSEPSSPAAPPKPWDGGARTAVAVAAPPAREPMRWTQVVLGVGAVTAGLYAANGFLKPHVRKWIASFAESDPEKQALKEEQRRMASALTDLATNHTELRASVESLRHALEDTVSEYKSAAAHDDVSDVRDELKSLTSTIKEHSQYITK